MLSVMETKDATPCPDLAVWNGRRLELRQILWNLLTGGYIAPPSEIQCSVIASGQNAEDILEENHRRYYEALPEQRACEKKLSCTYDKSATWTTHIIEYTGWPGEPAQRAVLRIPHNCDRQLPAVLVFHGHIPGCLLGKEEVSYLAIPLTARGFVTLCPDAIRWGDRRDKTYEKAEIEDFHGMSFYSERNLAMPLLLKGQTLLGAMTWEHMRAVDVLTDMDCVDADRIGCIGFSMGGEQSFWLSAMDERIRCGVEGCGVSSNKIWAECETLNALVNFIPHILRYTDTWEIGSLIAPRPFMCLDAVNDDFFPVEGIRQTVSEIARTYSLYGQSDKFVSDIHDGGHTFIQKHYDMAIEWLERWLKD